MFFASNIKWQFITLLNSRFVKFYGKQHDVFQQKFWFQKPKFGEI